MMQAHPKNTLLPEAPHTVHGIAQALALLTRRCSVQKEAALLVVRSLFLFPLSLPPISYLQLQLLPCSYH
jgi:hypothetical protein